MKGKRLRRQDEGEERSGRQDGEMGRRKQESVTAGLRRIVESRG